MARTRFREWGKQVASDATLPVSLLLGALGGLLAYYSVGHTAASGPVMRAPYVLDQESPFGLAVAGFAIGLLGITLTAIALTRTLSRGLIAALTGRGGMRQIFRAFEIVAVVSASAAAAGLAAAIESDSGKTSLQAVLFGVTIWLITWAMAAAVRLVFLFVALTDSEASLEGVAEDHRDEPGGPKPPVTVRRTTDRHVTPQQAPRRIRPSRPR